MLRGTAHKDGNSTTCKVLKGRCSANEKERAGMAPEIPLRTLSVSTPYQPDHGRLLMFCELPKIEL